ncbi:MAG: hypothetical protein R3275_01555 [Saprospiraceae bacterium]|nr:hypothetical protein [Saprospiraceae bacterium]
MDINRIPGQKKLKESILKQITDDHWPHTAMIQGGADATGLALAMALSEQIMLAPLEEKKSEAARNKIRQLIHPDINYSFPVQGAKNTSDEFLAEWRDLILANPFRTIHDWAEHHATDRGQININVAECQNIFRKLSLKAFEGGRKILIIWGAEYLRKEGNRLLKLLEEPPDHTFIILVTERMDLVLPTILSRCQLYRMLPLSKEDAVAFLIREFELAESKAQEIYVNTDGSIGQMMRLVYPGEELPMEIEPWIDTITNGDFEGMMAYAREFNRLHKEQQKILFVGGLAKLRRALAHNEHDGVIFAGILGDPIDIQIVSEISNCFTAIIEGLERNAHVQALIMSWSIKLWKVFKSRKVVST